MSELVLSVDKLAIEMLGPLGPKLVVKDFHIEISRGETVAVVGESGSGKSVSSLAIMQLLPEAKSLISGHAYMHESGVKYSLLDGDVEGLRGSKIAMVFQEPMAALNPVMRCGIQVDEALSAHQKLNKAERKEKVLELFGMVELPDPERMYSSFPFELSGGQQQRVMIAMALANEPLLLIADEPTTALDPEVQSEILALLRSMQKRLGFAMLFISHDLMAVKHIADQVVVMKNGEVLESGSVDQIFNRAIHPYTKALIACKPSPEKRGFKLPTVQSILNEEPIAPILNDPVSEIELIGIRHVSLVYEKKGFLKPVQKTPVLDNISLSIAKGERLGLIGPSGCGKSSLGKILSGWVMPSSGEILLNGRSVIKAQTEIDKRLWAREVQLIFQDPFGSLNPRMRVGEAIIEPIMVHKLVDNRRQAIELAHSLLEKVGLDRSSFNRYPHEFSGGQRQRIVIARALAVRPKLLVCDESVAALDVSVQAQVLNLLLDLQAEFGLSYLFISHDHDVVRYFCHRIAYLATGKIQRIEDLSAQNSETNAKHIKVEAVEMPVSESIELPMITTEYSEPEDIDRNIIRDNESEENLVDVFIEAEKAQATAEAPEQSSQEYAVVVGESDFNSLDMNELSELKETLKHLELEASASEIGIPKISVADQSTPVPEQVGHKEIRTLGDFIRRHQ